MRAVLWSRVAIAALAIALGVPAQVRGDCQCTEYEAGQYQPAFAPHGNELAFVTANWYPPWFEYWEAIVAPEFYFGRSADVKHPTWAPDASRIAFSMENQVWVTPRSQPDQGDALTSGFMDSDPAWSPSGGLIAFIRNGNVWTMHEDGGFPVQITTPGDCSEPAIAPDGTRVAYGRGGSIWVQTLAPGATAYRLTEGARPAWSPNGAWLAFDSARAGDPDIWVIASGGPTAVRITTDPGADTDPTWSGDGTRIAYTHATATCNCIRTVQTIPDYTVTVQSTTWGRIKAMYR